MALVRKQENLNAFNWEDTCKQISGFIVLYKNFFELTMAITSMMGMACTHCNKFLEWFVLPPYVEMLGNKGHLASIFIY